MFSKLRRYLPLSAARIETKLKKMNKKIEKGGKLSNKNAKQIKEIKKDLEDCQNRLQSILSQTDRLLLHYDEVVSLGYNCEVSFRLIDALDGVDDIGALSSYTYSWCYVESREHFCESLEQPTVFLSGEVELTPSKMLRCKNTNMTFHLKQHGEELLDEKDEYSEELYRLALEDTKSRVHYLGEKLLRLMESDKRTLFVLKVRSTVPSEDADFIFAVYQKLLSLYKSGEFTLLAVLEQNGLTREIQSLESTHIKIRTIQNFAPDWDTKDGGDKDGWMRVLKEFV